MPAGRPTDFKPEMTAYKPDILCGFNNKWRGVRETEWCAFAMERSADWLPVIGKGPFDKVELEYQVSIKRSKGRSSLPRIDAVGWRNGRATLIETKVNVSPSSVLGGVGQLLYYEQAVKRLLGWSVEDLILFTPAWPRFLVETVEANALSVTLVMATPESFYCVRSPVRQ